MANTRGGNSVRDAEKKSNKKLFIGGAVLLFILIALWLNGGKEEQKVEEKDSNRANIETGRFNFNDKEEEKAEKKEFKAEPIVPKETVQRRIGDAKPKAKDTMTINKSSSNFVTTGSKSSSGGGKNISQSLAEAAIEDGNNRLDDARRIGDTTDGGIYKSPVFEAQAAQINPLNPNLSIKKGTYIPCVLNLRVVTNVTGQISCTIADNVYSSNGNVILVPKGSLVNGFYQGGTTEYGSEQIFAVWQEIRTPDNLLIPIDSGSTDELGAAGLSGWVDNHFWLRFKNAVLLSMIQDTTVSIATNLASNDNAEFLQNTREGTSDLAQSILDKMGDIRPTLYKNQGDKVGIFVARDIDFSDVYELGIE